MPRLTARGANPCLLQALPVFQRLRVADGQAATNNGTAIGQTMAPAPLAAALDVVEGQSVPTQIMFEVADAEDLLKERDACGVSVHYPISTRKPCHYASGPCLSTSNPHCYGTPWVLQVGLIASLKNEAKHEIVEQALTALGCMEHRGACSSDDVSGDGAGLMTKVPWALFKADFPHLNEATTG